MYSRSSPAVPVLLQRLPDLLDRLPHIPAMPEPLRRFGARLSRLNTWQVFAAMVPAGLALGLLMSLAVDTEMLQRAGKPYIERLDDGARVEMARSDDGYPVDPAPFGYPDIVTAAPETTAIEVTDPATTAEAAPPVLISDGDVLAQSANAAPIVEPVPVIIQP